MKKRLIDLRSDTVTRPTPAMRRAMAEAEVGDDVYGEDPTVKALERRTAELLGKEAALFVPSGTMANQIAVGVHTAPGDELLCDATAHVYVWEGGGIARLWGVTTRTIERGSRPAVAGDLRGKIRPDDGHYVRTRLVCLENTHNRGGGRVYPIGERSPRSPPGRGARPGHAPRRRPADERGRRLGHRRAATGRGTSTRSRSASRRGWAPRSARRSPARPRRSARPTGSARCSAAGCGRPASSPPRRFTPWSTTSTGWPTTTPTPRSWPGPSRRPTGLSPRIGPGRDEPRLDRRRPGARHGRRRSRRGCRPSGRARLGPRPAGAPRLHPPRCLARGGRVSRPSRSGESPRRRCAV